MDAQFCNFPSDWLNYYSFFFFGWVVHQIAGNNKCIKRHKIQQTQTQNLFSFSLLLYPANSHYSQAQLLGKGTKQCVKIHTIQKSRIKIYFRFFCYCTKKTAYYSQTQLPQTPNSPQRHIIQQTQIQKRNKSNRSTSFFRNYKPFSVQPH